MSPEAPSKRSRLWQRIEALGDSLKGHVNRISLFSWGTIVFGAAIASASLWPVATSVWAFLSLSGAQTLQVVGVVVGGALLTIGVVCRSRGRATPIGLFRLILAGWLLACAAVGALTAGAWWLLDTPTWEPPTTLTPRDLDAIATRAFAVIAGLGGVALLVISYRRQRTTENSEQREQTRLFTERFDIASEKLGSEQPAVRLAGVHALAHLADDAPMDRDDLVQMVIDVLCAYLRMPYEPGPGPVPEDATENQRADHEVRQQAFKAFREVRHTAIRIITEHLRHETRWRGMNFDFTGAVFDGGDFSFAVFNGGSVSFRNTKFVGAVFFVGVNFSGANVNFVDSEFTGGSVRFSHAKFSGGRVDFIRTQFSGGHVSFTKSEVRGGTIDFGLAKFLGTEVDFARTKFSEGTTSFVKSKFSSGHVYFYESEFIGGRVSFLASDIEKHVLSFHNSQFSAGQVIFFDPDTPDMQARGERPAGIKGETINEPSGIVQAPPEWVGDFNDNKSETCDTENNEPMPPSVRSKRAQASPYTDSQ